MKREFNQEEIKEVVRTARVYAPDYSEERFHAMVESQSRLGDTRLLEAARSVIRLEEELGVACEQVVERWQEVFKKLPEVEAKLAQRQRELDSVTSELTQAKAELKEICRMVEEGQTTILRQEKELAAMQRRAEAEKSRLAAEVDKARQEARLSVEQVAKASRLSAELERRGLTVDFVATLCQEIPDEPEARSRLAAAIQRHGSLTGDSAAVEKRLGEVKAELARTEEHVGAQRQALQKLTREKEHEERVHSFFRRYQVVGPLMECLATWESVVFRRCEVCGARFWAERKQPRGLVHFQRDYYTCPCCGGLAVPPDSQGNVAAGMASNNDIPVRIPLGGL